MSQKLYVLATQQVYSDKHLYKEGEIASVHTATTAARAQAEKLAKKASFPARNMFVVVTWPEDLEKGQCYPEVLEKWKQDDYDQRALWVMKCIIDPGWHGRPPLTADQLCADLVDLRLSIEELHARYEQVAKDQLEGEARKKLVEAERRAKVFATKSDLADKVARDEITITFPAVRGMQAGKAYYVAQVPYPTLLKLFKFDEEDVLPADMRAQRVLNERRAEDIGNYIAENPYDYVLPAITASVSAEMNFEAVEVPGAADRVGLLHVPLDATFLINDGQHRRRGIEHALRKSTFLRDETIAVTIFYDQGLQRSQQIFADINGKQVKPSNAINSLYDRRNPFNAWAISVVEMVPEIRKRIDFENASVGAKSMKLWSILAFKKFISHLTGITEKNIQDQESDQLRHTEDFIVEFFDECRRQIPQWSSMLDGHVSAFEVRENLVIGHAVWLEALGIFGRRALFYKSDRCAETGPIHAADAEWAMMEALGDIEPQKAAKMWDGRCVVLGKMQKTTDGVKSTASQLLKLAKVPLTDDMSALEERLAGN